MALIFTGLQNSATKGFLGKLMRVKIHSKTISGKTHYHAIAAKRLWRQWSQVKQSKTQINSCLLKGCLTLSPVSDLEFNNCVKECIPQALKHTTAHGEKITLEGKDPNMPQTKECINRLTLRATTPVGEEIVKETLICMKTGFWFMMNLMDGFG